MPDRDQLEERLRQHVTRLAEQPVRPDLDARIFDHVDAITSQRHGVRTTSAVLLTTVLLVVALLALATGHQVNNVFSNISSGLGT